MAGGFRSAIERCHKSTVVHFYDAQVPEAGFDTQLEQILLEKGHEQNGRIAYFESR